MLYESLITSFWIMAELERFQVFAVVLCGWLGGFQEDEVRKESGRLLTIEEVGEILSGMKII